MRKAIVQAGSAFTGWMSSCLFCLDSSDDDERVRHQQAMKHKGAEREMQICHSQPHLVPPMKLVVYDDLPSPGPPRASSFPTWVMEEGRSLASRASSRASMSFRRKSTAPVRISAPTDFRRVTTLPTISTARTDYTPLELSFQGPANPLPDLPRFSDFESQDKEEHVPSIARPPRALSTMTDFSYQTRPRTYRPSSSFNLPRKPVGSGSRRSSLATLELLMERQIPASHPLIPHFSVRSSTASIATGLASTSFHPPPAWPVSTPPLSNTLPLRESHDATAPTTQSALKSRTQQIQSKSLPPIPVKTQLSNQQSYEPELPAAPVATDNKPFNPSANPSLSRSSRVAQWLLQQSSSPRPSTSGTATSRPSSSPKQSFSFSDKISMRIRSRTLSGSTLAPSVNNIDTVSGGLKNNAFMATPTARTSTLDSGFEKDFEMPDPYPGSYHYVSASQQAQSKTMSAHPAIQGQRRPDDTLNLDSYSYSHSYPYENHRNSAIGVAY